MDENEVMTQEVETVPEEELSLPTSNEDIASMWAEDDSDIPEIDEDESNAESEEANQLDTDRAEGNPEIETAENADAIDADQYLELKHFDEVKKVSKEEAKVLAQKGMDYDRIRGKLTEAESNTAKLKKYEEFLNGMKGDFATVDDLIDDVRARMIADQEEISYDAALNRVRNAQQQTQQAQQPIDIDEAIRQKSLDSFLQLYPDVPAKDIPQEVWDDFRVTNNLVASYARYQSKTSAKENETLKQNLKNKNRSTGSMNSSGAKKYVDDIERMWYEDDY